MLAKRGGLDLAQAFHVSHSEFGDGFVHWTKSQLILNGIYDVNFTMDLGLQGPRLRDEIRPQLRRPARSGRPDHANLNPRPRSLRRRRWSTQVVELLEERWGRICAPRVFRRNSTEISRALPTMARRFCGAPRAWRTTGQRRPGPSAHLQAFLQAVPNLGCFSPSLSKGSFGGFVGFQGVTRIKNHKSRFPNFLSSPRLQEPVARRQTRLHR